MPSQNPWAWVWTPSVGLCCIEAPLFSQFDAGINSKDSRSLEVNWQQTCKGVKVGWGKTTRTFIPWREARV